MTVNTNVNSQLPVRGIEMPVLGAGITNTGVGAWIDVSGLINFTLFFSGLESVGTLKVEVANGTTAPTNGAIIQAALAPDANHCVSLAVAGFHWLRVSKTQGTTPTLTLGTLHGIFA